MGKHVVHVMLKDTTKLVLSKFAKREGSALEPMFIHTGWMTVSQT